MTKLDYFGMVFAVTLMGAIGVAVTFKDAIRFYAQVYCIVGTFLLLALTLKRNRAG